MAPRLFPDMAAAPTATERRAARAWTHQPALFDTDTAPPAPACPVCAGDHTEDDCPHGTAPTLPLPATRNPSNPAQVRAMFASFGWSVTK